MYLSKRLKFMHELVQFIHDYGVNEILADRKRFLKEKRERTLRSKKIASGIKRKSVKHKAEARIKPVEAL